MILRLRYLLLALCMLCGFANAAERAWRYTGDRISFDQWTAYFDELANTKGAKLSVKDDCYVIDLFSDPKQPALYVFTKPGHPAYPAVVIRYVESDGKSTTLHRRGHYVSDQAAFDKWWHQFDALDAAASEDR